MHPPQQQLGNTTVESNTTTQTNWVLRQVLCCCCCCCCWFNQVCARDLFVMMEAPAVPVAGNPHHSMDILDEIFGSEWSASQQTTAHDNQRLLVSDSRTELVVRRKNGETSGPAHQHPPTCLTPGPTLSQHSSVAETCFSPAAPSSQDTSSVIDDNDNEAAISEHDHKSAGDFIADTTTPPPRRNSNNSIRGTYIPGVSPSLLSCC